MDNRRRRNDLENVVERRPTTRKEIKFFGTASFDDESHVMVRNSRMPAGKASPKFNRTHSVGDKLNPAGGHHRFFGVRTKISNEYNKSMFTCEGKSAALDEFEKTVNRFDKSGLSVTDDLWLTDQEQEDTLPDDMNAIYKLKRSKISRFRQRSTSICIDEWDGEKFGTLCPITSTSDGSSATELISRRGVFSRRHYGSVDQLPQSDVEGCDQNLRRFRLENGESLAEKDEVFGSPSTPILENPEHQTRWYFKYFLGKLHQNYVGIDTEKCPYFLSIVSQDSGNKYMPLYRAILFRKQGAQKIALPYSPHQKLTVKQILTHFPAMDTSKTPKELFSADIQKDLLLLEEQEGSVNFKFGVVYMKSGQKVDDEMLSNEIGSEDFENFLSVLGERIRLKGWERYRGGLDVKGDMTGQYSVYTLYEGHEIMFHVSTLLPFSRDNRQQVERKRHIGNDIVNIVFIDGETDGTEFTPNCIKSQFTHIFAVVTKIGTTFRLSVYCDETVPPFGPTLPDPPEFLDSSVFREFLLVKLINGEKATFQTPTFSRKRERTLEMLIKDLYEEYVHDSKMTMLNRRAFSEVLYDAPRASRFKEDARQVEFVRIGQALKLEAIVRGDAPTSIASAGPGSVFKRPPWEPQCFYASFHHRGNLVGDSWGLDSLFLATDEGTCLVREDQTYQFVFDKTLCVRQLSVVEDHGIMLLRGGSTTHKDGHRIHVFRLSEFKEENMRLRSRVDVKDHRMEKTRGCHMYTISKGNDGHLRMAASVGRKLLTFQWKHTAAWTSWCPNSDNDTVDGFIFLREINLHDSPTIMTILENPTGTKNANNGSMICVGYKHHFEIVSEQSAHSTKLHETETTRRSQTHLVAALDLCDGQETELLLCYNHTCHFQKLSDEEKSSSEFDFHWNTSPTSIVCAFPYIIAFTSDSMEIRLLVNGNLVHTVTMAELQLITSKRDIYFATTAPEFIPKVPKMKEAETTNEIKIDHGAARSGNKITDISNERIMEIKHKIERIEAQQPSYSRSSSESDDQLGQSFSNTLHINPQDNHMKFLKNPNDNDDGESGTPSIHRARSLQSTKEKNRSTEEWKRQISKSNSCGENYPATHPEEREFSLPRHFQEPTVPPNSPKQQSTVTGPADTSRSPPRKSSKHLISRNLHLGDNLDAPEKQKPLRIYRIPLANLTGTHAQNHHHHPYHHTNSSRQTKFQSNKIVEDHSEEIEATDPASGTHFDDDDRKQLICNSDKDNIKHDNCTCIPIITSS